MKNTVIIDGQAYAGTPELASHYGLRTVTLRKRLSARGLKPTCRIGNKHFYDLTAVAAVMNTFSTTLTPSPMALTK